MICGASQSPTFLSPLRLDLYLVLGWCRSRIYCDCLPLDKAQFWLLWSTLVYWILPVSFLVDWVFFCLGWRDSMQFWVNVNFQARNRVFVHTVRTDSHCPDMPLHSELSVDRTQISKESKLKRFSSMLDSSLIYMTCTQKHLTCDHHVMAYEAVLYPSHTL